MKLERRLVRGVAAATTATGALQAAVPGATLGPLKAEDSPTVRQFFGTVGMFMACTGGVLLARSADPAVVLMTAAQKLGASAAVGLGVRRGLLSPAALAVASFDAVSGLIALDYWRRLPGR